MALNEADIATIEGVIGTAAGSGDLRGTLSALRSRFPGMVFLACDAADVLEEPWRSTPAIDLHLVDTRNHCAEMTSDPAVATGLLLAARGRAA